MRKKKIDQKKNQDTITKSKTRNQEIESERKMNKKGNKEMKMRKNYFSLECAVEFFFKVDTNHALIPCQKIWRLLPKKKKMVSIKIEKKLTKLLY